MATQQGWYACSGCVKYKPPATVQCAQCPARRHDSCTCACSTVADSKKSVMEAKVDAAPRDDATRDDATGPSPQTPPPSPSARATPSPISISDDESIASSEYVASSVEWRRIDRPLTPLQEISSQSCHHNNDASRLALASRGNAQRCSRCVLVCLCASMSLADSCHCVRKVASSRRRVPKTKMVSKSASA